MTTRGVSEEEARAPFRYMTVIAQDPSVRRNGKIVMAKVAVPSEDLVKGPVGYRVQLVDYDATRRSFLGSHVLPKTYELEPKAWRRGDSSIVKDLRFHAQNTYALVMRTLARFEFALGRRIGWSFDAHQIKVAPHGMADANAFYSPDVEGLVFGYFDGASGRRVDTCLSHDIIVHETTHALIDGLRPKYMYPSNVDQGAFHEGFADVIALLSVFSQPEVVEHLMQRGRKASQGVPLMQRRDLLADALRESALFGLADEMGSELEGVRGQALRQSAKLEPDPKLKDTEEFREPHRRGELFVAAVMQGFIKAWSERVLSAGVPGQKTFPARRVAQEGADVADTLATMWIRAIDYMPPVHLEFGDALSAALTGDFEVRPDDTRFELRRHMVSAFRSFGFAPASDRKDPPGVWHALPEEPKYDRVRFESMRTDKDEVFRFIWDNRDLLRLRARAYTEVLSVRPTVRIGRDGFTVRETVAQYYQVARLTPDEMASQGITAPEEYLKALKQADKRGDGDADHHQAADADAADNGDETASNVTPLYGGAVLIFDEYGRVKYCVRNDVFHPRQTELLDYLWKEGILRTGKKGSWLRPMNLASVHLLRAVSARSSQSERW